jgi:hypothetical protein
MTNNDIFLGHGVEVKIDKEQDFLKIRETLTRIGVASKKDKKIFQSCHILHKQGRYAIVHFKELFSLDGKQTDFSEDDKSRRNTIAFLLEDWELLKILNPEKIKDQKAPLSQIKILTFKEKNDWELVPKYTIGNKK